MATSSACGTILSATRPADSATWRFEPWSVRIIKPVHTIVLNFRPHFLSQSLFGVRQQELAPHCHSYIAHGTCRDYCWESTARKLWDMTTLISSRSCSRVPSLPLLFLFVCSRSCVCPPLFRKWEGRKQCVKGADVTQEAAAEPSLDVALNMFISPCGLPTHAGHLREPADSATKHPGPRGRQRQQEHSRCTNAAQPRYIVSPSPPSPFSFGPSAPLKSNCLALPSRRASIVPTAVLS